MEKKNIQLKIYCVKVNLIAVTSRSP